MLFLWVFLLVFLLFEKGSVTFHICCSWSCKCSSHHFDPSVLYQCGCVLCCDIPGGNHPGCLAPPQHEKDRVGWQVCVQAFPVWFWDIFTQIRGSSISKGALCGGLQFLLSVASWDAACVGLWWELCCRKAAVAGALLFMRWKGCSGFARIFVWSGKIQTE